MSEHADVVVGVGQCTLGAGNGDVLDHGKCIVIRRNENGQWKLNRDFWNSNIADAG